MRWSPLRAENRKILHISKKSLLQSESLIVFSAHFRRLFRKPWIRIRFSNWHIKVARKYESLKGVFRRKIFPLRISPFPNVSKSFIYSRNAHTTKALLSPFSIFIPSRRGFCQLVLALLENSSTPSEENRQRRYGWYVDMRIKDTLEFSLCL